MGLVARNMAVLLGGAALAVLTNAQMVRAQQADATTTATEEEQVKTTPKKGRVTVLQRIVIGAGVDKVAIDTPQSVTVIDQEDIDREQATTIGDVLKETPGVQVIGSDRVFGEAFNIRGIGATENSADAARIVVTVDGAPKFNEQYRMGSFFSDPELYKRVEVLRGPASSTLYGSGAIGGVINFQTKDAADFIAEGDRGAVRLKSSYETNGDGTLMSGIFAHRFNDQFEVLAQGNWRRSDDMEKANGKTLTGSEFSSYSGLLKGTYRIDDEAILRASYQRWDSDQDDQPYTQTSSSDPLFGDFGTQDRHVIDQTYVLSYENPASDNPWLDLNVALTYSDTQNLQDNAKSPLIPNPPTPNTPGQTAILYPTDYGYKTLQLKADNTFDYTGSNFENFLTVGFQASHQLREAGRPSGARALPAHPEGTEDKLGLFVQNEYILNERLTITPGARVDFYKMTPEDSVFTNAPDAEEVTGTAFSPKIAALYKLSDNFNVFGSIAHTERFPTLDELFSVSYSGNTIGRALSLDLQKEKSNNYEIGFGHSVFDIGGGSNSLAFKATAFYNDITDGIRINPASSSAGQPYYINVNGIEIYGVELEGAFESDYGFVRLAYTNLHGEYSNVVGNNVIVPGQAVETIPQDKLVLTVAGRLPDYGLTYGATATFAAEGDAYVSAAATGDPDPAGETFHDWQRVDLFATWKPTEGKMVGWEAQFGVTNLFNQDYRENLLADRSKGRSVKFTLAKQFGYQ